MYRLGKTAVLSSSAYTKKGPQVAALSSFWFRESLLTYDVGSFPIA